MLAFSLGTKIGGRGMFSPHSTLAGGTYRVHGGTSEFTCSHLSRNLSCDVCDVSCHVIQRSNRLTYEE